MRSCGRAAQAPSNRSTACRHERHCRRQRRPPRCRWACANAGRSAPSVTSRCSRWSGDRLPVAPAVSSVRTTPRRSPSSETQLRRDRRLPPVVQGACDRDHEPTIARSPPRREKGSDVGVRDQPVETVRAQEDERERGREGDGRGQEAAADPRGGVADDGDREDDRPRCHLPQRDRIQKLSARHPVVAIDGVVLHERDDHEPTAVESAPTLKATHASAPRPPLPTASRRPGGHPHRPEDHADRRRRVHRRRGPRRRGAIRSFVRGFAWNGRSSRSASPVEGEELAAATPSSAPSGRSLRVPTREPRKSAASPTMTTAGASTRRPATRRRPSAEPPRSEPDAADAALIPRFVAAMPSSTPRARATRQEHEPPQQRDVRPSPRSPSADPPLSRANVPGLAPSASCQASRAAPARPRSPRARG